MAFTFVRMNLDKLFIFVGTLWTQQAPGGGRTGNEIMRNLFAGNLL